MLSSFIVHIIYVVVVLVSLILSLITLLQKKYRAATVLIVISMFLYALTNWNAFLNLFLLFIYRIG